MRGGFYVPLFVCFDLLLHLDLLGMPLFGVKFGAQAGEGAGGFRGFVGGAGDAFTGAFVVVEAGGVVSDGVFGGAWGGCGGGYRLPCCFVQRSMYSF